MGFHERIGAVGHPAASENRKAALARLREEAQARFRDETQAIDDVVRARLRDKREERQLTQVELARRVTAAGVPMTGKTICEIETGVRPLKVRELWHFAEVLRVPYVRLTTPREGDDAVRISEGSALYPNEVANWMVWGQPWTEEARGAQAMMKLTREIAFWRQAAHDEPGHASHNRRIAGLVEQLRATVRFRPGVLRRSNEAAAFLARERGRAA